VSATLRLLIVSNIKGGVSRFTNELIYGLCRKGIEVEKVDLFRKSYGYSLNPALIPKILLGGFDVFHINFASPGLLTFLRKKVGKKPYVYTVHGVPNPQIEADQIYKVLYEIEDRLLPVVGKSANECLAISKYVAEELHRRCDVHASVIYPGIDATRYGYKEEWKDQIRGKLEIQDNETVFLFVGRLHRAKDPVTLLLAMKMFSSRTATPCKLLIIGSGELRNRLGFMVNLDENLKRNVIFMGEVPFNEVAKYYSASDALVLPSLIEGFGYVAIEAMSSPIPVIASTACACPEVVGDGGIFFNPGDPKELASKLMLLAGNSDLRKKLATRGLRRVKELFTADRMVDEYLAVYDRVVKR